MGKLTLEELRKLRQEQKDQVSKRDTEGKNIEIIIGMGTCGIAAGAKQTMDSFLSEIDKNNLNEVAVKQAGCMGFCQNEPTVEVRVPDMPRVIYNNVDEAVAKKIVEDHIIGKKLVDDHIVDKPSVDILDK